MTNQEAMEWFKENMPEWGYEADIYCAETCYGKGDWICTEPEGYAYKAAIEALEKAERYRVHDLSKNQTDLPTKQGKYLVLLESETIPVFLDFNNELKMFGSWERCNHSEMEGCPDEIYFWGLDEEDEVPIAWQEVEISDITKDIIPQTDIFYSAKDLIPLGEAFSRGLAQGIEEKEEE